MKTKQILLTGASGYLGRALLAALIRRGFTVTTVTRQPSKQLGVRNIPGWSLQNPELSAAVDGDVLIHCAWDMSLSNEKANMLINERGSEILLHEAQRLGFQNFFFISSTSAFAEAQSVYGRSKFKVEQRFRSLGGIIIRPGLIYGGMKGGMVNTLASLVSRLPLLPLFGKNQMFYMSEIKTLADAIATLVAEPELYDPTKPVLASNKPVSFGSLMHNLAKGKHIILLPTPWPVLYYLLRIVECFGFKLPLKSDSLLSMMTLPKSQPVNEKLPFPKYA